MIASRTWLASLVCAVHLSAGAMGGMAAPLKFFRSDTGIASIPAGPFPVRLDSAEHLLWRKPLDSGHSTPTEHAGKLFLTTFDAAKKELATVALDAATGDLLWRQVAPTTRIEPYHHVGSPAAPTPACDGRRLYVLFGSLGLVCYDLGGREEWTLPMGPFQDEFGSGSSPVLTGDKVIVAQDHDLGSLVMAVDAKTGRILWRTERPDAVRSYSTPLVWTRGGKREALVAGALELSAYDIETGRRTWWVNGLARIVIPMPVVGSNTVV